jgi:hypothetical protein
MSLTIEDAKKKIHNAWSDSLKKECIHPFSFFIIVGQGVLHFFLWVYVFGITKCQYEVCDFDNTTDLLDHFGVFETPNILEA